MLEQAHRLSLHQLIDHVAENSADGVKALVSVANVRQACLIQEDLLNDEDCDSLLKLGPGLHDPQTERNDLR